MKKSDSVDRIKGKKHWDTLFAAFGRIERASCVPATGSINSLHFLLPTEKEVSNDIVYGTTVGGDSQI